MLGTDFILESLTADGVTHLFMVPGGLVDPFLPALGRNRSIAPVIAAQEGGASFMADGYARAGGRYGACLCIGGPGATNTVTAISAAYTDESPVLLLTGEVANELQGIGLFQDATAGTYDDGTILRPVTAESYNIPSLQLLPHALRRALHRMFDGARAPVHLSVPHDVQIGEITVPPQAVSRDLLASAPLDGTAARTVWTLLEAAATPAVRVALLVGGGIIADDASDVLVRAAERFALPVATTEHAKGTFPEDHPLSLGVFGYAGTCHATAALLNGDLDLLIVLGTALNVRDSMNWSSKLAPKLGVVSVNVSALDVGDHVPDPHFVSGHGGAFAAWLAGASDADAAALSAGSASRRDWVASIKSQPRYYDEENMASDAVPIHPARLVRDVRAATPRETVALVDSGAHRAFAAHYWESYGPRRFLTAAALGPMGWAIGAGIGAKAARPDSPVVVFTGDGCMRMHGMEVQSAVRAGLPVIFVVSNNQALGNVWLRARAMGEVPMELTEAPDQDWAAFARALGAEGITVRQPGEIAPAIAAALASKRTTVLDVKTDRTATTPVEPFAQSAAAWSYHE